MASYRGHLFGGFVAAVGYTLAVTMLPVAQMAEYAHVLNGTEAIAAVFVIAMLFSLFPDVDTKSKGQWIFYWLVFLLDGLLIWTRHLEAAAYLGLIATLPLLGHHRGITHRKLAALIVPLPIVIIPYLYNEKMLPISVVYYGAAAIGYLSHLLLDGLIVKWFRIRGRRFDE